MPNRKAKHDVAPIVRAAFIGALKRYHKKTGKTLSEAMADFLESDFHETLRAVARFNVREHQVSGNVTTTHKLDLNALSETELSTLEALLGKATIRHRDPGRTSPPQSSEIH